MNVDNKITVTLQELMQLEYLVSDFSLLPRQPVHSVLAGKHASRLRGRGLDFSEVRKYVYGDDVRNIDWRVTARSKVPHTKVFTEEKERPAFLMVDQSSSMFFASAGSTKSVMAAGLAAIAGFKVLKAGDRLGGLVFDDEEYQLVSAHRSRNSLMHLLEIIVEKNHQLAKRTVVHSKKENINRVLLRASHVVTHDHVVLVISDFQRLDEEGRKHLINIARHNDVIAAIISDPLEFDLPAIQMPLGDGVHQVMASGKEDERVRFHTARERMRQQNLQFLQRYRIPVMEFTTTISLPEQIKKIFGGRR